MSPPRIFRDGSFSGIKTTKTTPIKKEKSINIAGEAATISARCYRAQEKERIVATLLANSPLLVVSGQGMGKSMLARFVADDLRSCGFPVAVISHKTVKQVLVDIAEQLRLGASSLDCKTQTTTQFQTTIAEKLKLKLLATVQYGIFSRLQPAFDERLVRLDVSKLPPELGAIAGESLARQVMADHRLRGEITGKRPRTFLVIDEAKEMPATAGSACDRIIADGRKYGLALILASQSERHLSLDVIGNSSTKIALPVDQTEVKKVAGKFRFAEARVAALRPLVALCRFGVHAAQVEIKPYWQRV